MDSPPDLGVRPPACRASQVPWSFSRCAPSPITPESRATAHACVFVAHAGFTIFGRLAALIFVFRGRNGFAFATAHTVHLPGLRRPGYPIPPPGRLHVSQAFHMVSSFQLTRKTRLGLAHRRHISALLHPGPRRNSHRPRPRARAADFPMSTCVKGAAFGESGERPHRTRGYSEKHAKLPVACTRLVRQRLPGASVRCAGRQNA
jgi:hypothetical protein